MRAARQAGAVATTPIGIAIVGVTIIAGRILIFEYFHGSAATVRHLLHLLA
jgi:hypothetical protein